MGKFIQALTIEFNNETKNFNGDPRGLFSSDTILNSCVSNIEKTILTGRGNYNPENPVNIEVKAIYPEYMKEDMSIRDVLGLVGKKGFPGYECSRQADRGNQCKRGRKSDYQCSLNGLKVYIESGTNRPRLRIAPTCGSEPIGLIELYPSHISPILNGE